LALTDPSPQERVPKFASLTKHSKTCFIPMRVSIAASVFLTANSAEAQGGPIGKVVQLISNLQARVISAGEREAAAFQKFSRFCEKKSTETTYSIEDANEVINEENAKIDSAKSNLESLDAKINDASAKISALEKDLEQSKAERDEEHASFVTRDKDLANTIDMLVRAKEVIEKKLSKAKRADGSLLKVASTMKSVVDASLIALENTEAVNALLQETDGSQDDDDEGGAGVMLKTFDNLRDKATGSRNEAQQEEMKKEGAYKLFVLATSQELKANQDMMEAAKKAKNKNMEKLANAQASLEDAEKDKAADEKELADLQHECMDSATDFETAQRERAAELGALAKAKKMLDGVELVDTKQAPTDTAPLSFLQLPTEAELFQRQLRAASLLQNQGRDLHSWVLSQVGEHVRADPFEKVKRMIQEMLTKLESEQQGEASHKAWCDAEIAKTTESVNSKTDARDDVQTTVDQNAALASKLGDEIKELMKQIADIDDSTQKATAMRQAEHEDFLVKQKDMSTGQKAVATAIKVLRNYYEGGSFIQRQSHALSQSGFLQAMHKVTSEGDNKGTASSGIIGLLEVIESNYAKGLAEAQTEEDTAQKDYEEMMEDAKMDKAVKTQDVKNKNAEKLRIDNAVSEGQVDVAEAEKDLSAAESYLDKVKSACENKAPSFEQRQARRKQELEGLKNALSILEGKSVGFLQQQDPFA